MRRSCEKAHGDIAHVKGMVQVVRDAGLSHESLYKAFLGECSTGFDTILKVMAALSRVEVARRSVARVNPRFSHKAARAELVTLPNVFFSLNYVNLHKEIV
jgi:hypothetical protein